VVGRVNFSTLEADGSVRAVRVATAPGGRRSWIYSGGRGEYAGQVVVMRRVD